MMNALQMYAMATGLGSSTQEGYLPSGPEAGQHDVDRPRLKAEAGHPGLWRCCLSQLKRSALWYTEYVPARTDCSSHAEA